MSEVQAARARSGSTTAYLRFMCRGYDVGSAPLKQTCDVCRKIPRVHKSGRNEVRMRSTIVAVLSLFMTAAVMAWEPKNDPQIPDDGGQPLVYYVHSYYDDTRNV